MIYSKLTTSVMYIYMYVLYSMYYIYILYIRTRNKNDCTVDYVDPGHLSPSNGPQRSHHMTKCHTEVSNFWTYRTSHVSTH